MAIGHVVWHVPTQVVFAKSAFFENDPDFSGLEGALAAPQLKLQKIVTHFLDSLISQPFSKFHGKQIWNSASSGGGFPEILPGNLEGKFDKISVSLAKVIDSHQMINTKYNTNLLVLLYWNKEKDSAE